MLSMYSDSNSPFMTLLMKVVCDFSEADDIAGTSGGITTDSEYGRVSVMLLLKASLQVLTAFFSAGVETEGKAVCQCNGN